MHSIAERSVVEVVFVKNEMVYNLLCFIGAISFYSLFTLVSKLTLALLVGRSRREYE